MAEGADEAAQDALVVLLTTAPEKDAPRLARGLVEARLAACVARSAPMISVYRWKGALEEETEVQLVIKTSEARRAALVAWLEREHPYDVPELLVLRADDASAAYAAWVHAEVSDSP